MSKKRCFKCSDELPIEEFYKHPMMGDGHLGKCKRCTKSDVSENYRRRKEYYRSYEKSRNADPERRLDKMRYERSGRKSAPHKYQARMLLARAIRSGKMTRMPCQVCGDPYSEGHHPDYSKPLEVEWLCFVHHRERHGQEAAENWRARGHNR